MSSYPFRLPDGSIARKAADGSGTEQAPYRNRDLAELPAEQLAALASQATLAQVLAALAPLATETTLLDIETALALLATEAKAEQIRALLAGTLAVSGPVTDAQLRATPVPVSVAATPRTIVSVSVNATNSGDNTVVAASTGNRIRLIACHLHGNGDVNVSWKSGAATTLAAAMPMGVKGNGFVLPHAPMGEYWQRTASGQALILNLSAAVAVTGSLIYELEAA